MKRFNAWLLGSLLVVSFAACDRSVEDDEAEVGNAAPDVNAETTPPPVPLPPETEPTGAPIDTAGATTAPPPS